MHRAEVPAVFRKFRLPDHAARNACVAIPTVKGAWWLTYGKHAYYFMDFRRLEGIEVDISHSEIIRPGLARFRRAASVSEKFPGSLKAIFGRYHYDFNYLEEVMLMTVPHTVTPVGEGRFVVNLWSWFGTLLVDCRARTVTYHTTEDEGEVRVLGAAQWFDARSDELYAMSYSLEDSFDRISDPRRPVALRIFKHQLGTSASETVWEGAAADFMHDILVNETRRYLVACELGMYADESREIIPSRVLILDLENKKEWMLDRFAVAAHAQFDPVDPDVVYFSNHNFRFEHTSLFNLFRKGTYTVTFRGPASVYKYRLTPDGPRELGVFTRPDFFRLTNMHVFKHRGRKLLLAMGFPDEVFLVDAETMIFLRKIIVREPRTLKLLYSGERAMIGTIAPSPNGEKLFVQTTKSFQVVDIDSGEPDHIRTYFFSHSCANHMTAL